MDLIYKISNWYFRRSALPYWCIIILDTFICTLAALFTIWLNYHMVGKGISIYSVCNLLLVYTIINLISFKIFHTYGGILRYSSFVDLKRIALAVTFSFIVMAGFELLVDSKNLEAYFCPMLFRYILFIAALDLVGLCGLRVCIKSLYEFAIANKNTKRALIYGVKNGGIGLAKAIKAEFPTRFHLMGFVADENSFNNKFLMGEHVYFNDNKLNDIIKDKKIEVLLVSPLKINDFRKNLTFQNIMIQNNVHILLGGKIEEIDTENTLGPQLKDVSLEDLLPRDEIVVDMDSVGEMLKNKKVLITGSAGSIGSEMVRQIAIYHPAQMILIDQAETPQHDIRLMMKQNFPDILANTIVTSICKKDRMEEIFKATKLDFVFHAAAYKHVPMMENNPSESVQNNIIGTRIIADLSVKYGVKKFVMISTDKAVNPTNVMGCSKRICEIYVQSLDKAIKDGKIEGQTQFVTTRFGNVLGSNGSVIPLFTRQIKEGGPVTVTAPNIIRYFMLIPEACKLVLEAGTKGKGGEIFVFDMGNPVKITDLAKRMIYLSGAKNIEIKYTGLRAGEKLYEEVLNVEETTKPSFHKKIRIATVRQYDYQEVCLQTDKLEELSKQYDDMETVRQMKAMVPEYKSNNSIYDILDN